MEAFMYRDFDRLEDQHWWFAGRRQIVAAYLEHHLGATRGLRILDVGCGTGGMLPMLERWGEVSAFDPFQEAVDAAKARAPKAEIFRGEIPGAVPQNHAFDLVTAFDVLEHLDDPVEAVARIKGALAPRGLFIATVPAYPFLWSHHDEVNQHRRRYTARTLRQHLEAGGLTVDGLTHFNTVLFPPIAAARAVQKLLPQRGQQSDHSDTQDTPPLANLVLKQVFAAERHLIGRVPLPFGVSILAQCSARS